MCVCVHVCVCVCMCVCVCVCVWCVGVWVCGVWGCVGGGGGSVCVEGEEGSGGGARNTILCLHITMFECEEYNIMFTYYNV